MVYFKKYTDRKCLCFFRHYLPQLKAFPTQYIYEPWTAPEAVQKAAHCIIGKDYPLPMVDHTHVSRINMERMRQVYKHLLLRSSGNFYINVGLIADCLSQSFAVIKTYTIIFMVHNINNLLYVSFLI